MIQANHPRFSCTPDMSLTIYATIFSGPLMTTDTPSGTVLAAIHVLEDYIICVEESNGYYGEELPSAKFDRFR